MFESQAVRITFLFLVLGGASFILFSEFYEDPYRYYEKASESDLFLPSGAVEISYYQSGEDWQGYTFKIGEEAFREWTKENPWRPDLELVKGPASATYYSKEEEGLTHLYIEESLMGHFTEKGFSHFFIYDPSSNIAYYYKHRQ